MYYSEHDQRRIQANAGCAKCAYATNSTVGSKIQRGISQDAYNRLRASGADYFCTVFDKFVYNDQGRSCGQWKNDSEAKWR